MSWLISDVSEAASGTCRSRTRSVRTMAKIPSISVLSRSLIMLLEVGLKGALGALFDMARAFVFCVYSLLPLSGWLGQS